MANNNGELKEKAILLVQRWGAGKIPIGSKFKLKDTDRTITLVNCDGYSHGKFIFDDGEEFNVGKYFDAFFIEIVKKHEEQNAGGYNESAWDELDDVYNPKKENGEDLAESSIRKTSVQEQRNESFHDFSYFDVTEIIETMLKNENKNENNELFKKIYKYLNVQNFPFFTKERLSIVFNNCKFENTSQSGILRVKSGNTMIGFLAFESGKYFFAPKSKELSEEYSFESNNSVGFFHTAESYLDIALSTIERYRKEFLPLYHSNLEKNKESLGYQADSTIKTLLAFSCECYLKSILISDGKNLDEIKKLGHGLSVLFTSLDSDLIGYVFTYMERNGYNIEKNFYQQVYETNDLTEKFTLDLARVDDAFVDARYNAEKDKNTNYSFLYQFALALRKCSEKKNMLNSPFTESIESRISKK